MAEDGGGFFLDCPRALAPALVEKLNFYKLRAKVTVEDRSGRSRHHGSLGRRAARPNPALCYRRPAPCTRRVSAIILPPQLAAEAAADLGARLADASRLRGASHCARRRRAAATHFSLWQRLPARGRHGPARRRRFRQGLLRRPGGRLARRTSRKGAQSRSFRSPSTGLRRSRRPAGHGGRAKTWGDRIGIEGPRLHRCGSTASPMRWRMATKSPPAALTSDWSNRPGRRFVWPGETKGAS